MDAMAGTRHRREQGGSLLEALVSTLILSLGVLGATQTYAWFRFHGDLSRERAQAVRWAQQGLEAIRASDSGLVEAIPPYQPGHLQRAAGGDHLPLTQHDVSIHWTDRSAGTQAVTLRTLHADVDPLYSAALTLSTPDTWLAPRRHLPPQAVPFDSHGSVVRPSPTAGIVWIVSHLSGLVTAQCRVASSIATRDITSADLRDCLPAQGTLLSGYIRFQHAPLGASPSSEDTPLPTRVALQLTPEPEQPPHCDTDLVTGRPEPFVAYTCFVHLPAESPGWSGALHLLPVGWRLGEVEGTFRVCRHYSVLDDGDLPGRSNQRPTRYEHVRGPLRLQNYLVIPAQQACPDTPTTHNGVPVHTVAHQP